GRQAGVLEEKLDGARLVGQVALGDRVARRDQRRLAGTEDPLARYRDRHGLSVASSVPGGAAASWSGRAAARPGLADRARTSDDVEELGARAGVGAELAEQLARDHRHALLAYPARRHALVHALDDDADPFGLQHVVNAVRDLRRHRFLNLEPAREGLDDARELTDAHDLA